MSSVEARLTETRDKVHLYMACSGPVVVGPEGELSFARGVTRVSVAVRPHPNGTSSLVDVVTPVVIGVPANRHVGSYLSSRSASMPFGRLTARPSTDASVDAPQGAVGARLDVFLIHTLFGDFLDPDELLTAVDDVAELADALEDALVDRLGGRVVGEAEEHRGTAPSAA